MALGGLHQRAQDRKKCKAVVKIRTPYIYVVYKFIFQLQLYDVGYKMKKHKV